MVGTEEEARGNVFPPLLVFISHITERKCKYSFHSVSFLSPDFDDYVHRHVRSKDYL